MKGQDRHIWRLVMPPAAHSFPPCRKRMGRKGALGYVWCVLRVRFRQVLIFSRCEHANSPYVRLRALWYAPPVTVHQD